MKLLKFIDILLKLRKEKRTGWTKRNIKDPESVTEHSYLVAMLAMLLAKDAGVDQAKVIKMALIHDIAEAEIGDIIAWSRGKALPNYEGKIKLEKEAIKKIFKLIDGHEYENLFMEFEEKKTKEAKFLKQVDRLATSIQAHAYQTEHGIEMDEVYDYSRFHIEDKYLQELLNEILLNK